MNVEYEAVSSYDMINYPCVVRKLVESDGTINSYVTVNIVEARAGGVDVQDFYDLYAAFVSEYVSGLPNLGSQEEVDSLGEAHETLENAVRYLRFFMGSEWGIEF
jgi:hypothetical protein